MLRYFFTPPHTNSTSELIQVGQQKKDPQIADLFLFGHLTRFLQIPHVEVE